MKSLILGVLLSTTGLWGMHLQPALWSACGTGSDRSRVLVSGEVLVFRIDYSEMIIWGLPIPRARY